MLTPIMLHCFPRSGSTLLMMILSCLERVEFCKEYPFEERDLTYIVRMVNIATRQIDPHLRGELLNQNMNLLRGYPHQGASDFFADSDEAKRELFLRLWAGYSDSLRKKSDCLFYAEKVAAGVGEQVGSYMDTRTIVLVRDPRAVFNSILKFDAKRGFHGFGMQEGDTALDYAERFCNHQRHYLNWVLTLQAGGGMLRLSYEGLMGSFQDHLVQIESFVGQKLDRENLGGKLTSYMFHTTSDTAASSVHEWQTDLAEEVKAYIGEALAAELRMFGYA